MNLPIGSISGRPGVTHVGSPPPLKSRIQLLTLENLLPTLWNTSKHTTAHFALCAATHCDAETSSYPTDTCWWRHAVLTGKRGIWEESPASNYFLLFLRWIPPALLKGGAVCGASHAALGEPLYLIPKLRSDICQRCHQRHSILCIQLLYRGGGRT